ncbi:MAG: LysR family transcriptional regulator [Myxococcota bacterium]
MKLDEMQLLLRVADTGSMTVAARQLHLTPAAVSAAVKRIEESLGVRVFERTTRSVHPTDEGVEVLDGCEAIVERWQRTLERVQGGRRELEGTVHISAPADSAYQFVGAAVVAVCDAHPKLRVVLHSSDALHHLHRDAIDMAIRYGPMQDSTLAARKLTEWPGILVASPSYLERHPAPRTPDELVAHRAITLQLSSTPISEWILEGPSGARTIDLESPLCGDGFLARHWALEGKGIARKSLFDVIDDLEAKRLVRVLPEYASERAAIHMVFPSRRFVPARVRAFDAAISDVFKERADRCERWMASAP